MKTTFSVIKIIQLLPGLFALTAIFYNYTKYRLRIKIVLFLIIGGCLLFLFTHEEQKKAIERKERQYEAMQAHRERKELDKQLKDVKDKLESGGGELADYLRYISLHFDKLNMEISSFRLLFRKDFILDYFTDVDKIPAYFNLEEWKEAEKRIYHRNVQRIKGDFSARNMFSRVDSSLQELKEAREKLVQAKEREFSNKKQ